MRSHVCFIYVYICICVRARTHNIFFVLVKDISKTHTHTNSFGSLPLFRSRVRARERERNACLVRIQFYKFAEHVSIIIHFMCRFFCLYFVFSVWLVHGFKCLAMLCYAMLWELSCDSTYIQIFCCFFVPMRMRQINVAEKQTKHSKMEAKGKGRREEKK